jgi:hypothetical protein
MDVFPLNVGRVELNWIIDALGIVKQDLSDPDVKRP